MNQNKKSKKTSKVWQNMYVSKYNKHLLDEVFVILE